MKRTLAIVLALLSCSMLLVDAAGASTTTFKPVADAYVSSAKPNTNFGTSLKLSVDSSPVVRSYLRFKVQGVSASISSASLRLHANNASANGYGVRRVSSTTWGENAVTYANSPAVSSTVSARSGAFSAGAWTSVDITALVTTALPSGSGVFSLALTTSTSTAFSLASRETGARSPQLVITTTDPDLEAPTVPADLVPASVTATQVDLSWTASTDNVGVAGYTVYRDGTQLAEVAGNATSYSDASVSASTSYSYTVDAFDAAGNHSAQSGPAAATKLAGPASEARTDLTEVVPTLVTKTQVDLSWTV